MAILREGFSAFAHIKFMSLPQPTRHLLWRILDALVAHHRRGIFLVTMTQPLLKDIKLCRVWAMIFFLGILFSWMEKGILETSCLLSLSTELYALSLIYRIESRSGSLVYACVTAIYPSTLAQGMFDIIFCYFPITYRPLADDPYGITTEELQNALQCASIFSLFILVLTYMNFVGLV